MADTDDLVQNTLIRALDNVNQFEPRHEGAFLAYLRTILLNQVRDEIRRVNRMPGRERLDEGLRDASPSPVEEAIGGEALARYEAALSRLAADQREAVVLRVELGLSYPEVAEAMDRPSANSARLLVTRALVHLAKAMYDRT